MNGHEHHGFDNELSHSAFLNSYCLFSRKITGEDEHKERAECDCKHGDPERIPRSLSGTFQKAERSRSRNSQMQRWAPSSSLFFWSVGKLIKHADISARSIENLSRFSNSVRKVSIDFCICKSRCPQSPSLVLETISLVIAP